MTDKDRAKLIEAIRSGNNRSIVSITCEILDRDARSVNAIAEVYEASIMES